MKISSFGHRFDKLERLVHEHIEPSSKNRYRFQTIEGKTWKNSTILKEFDALTKVMSKEHKDLDIDEKRAIYRVLKTIKDLASDKINHPYVIFSQQSHPVLHKRMEKVSTLLFCLGITRSNPEVNERVVSNQSSIHPKTNTKTLLSDVLRFSGVSQIVNFKKPSQSNTD